MSTLPTYSPECHEQILIQAILNKQDPHSAVYCWLNGKSYEPIGGPIRAEIKRFNFPILYSEAFVNKVKEAEKSKSTIPQGDLK